VLFREGDSWCMYDWKKGERCFGTLSELCSDLYGVVFTFDYGHYLQARQHYDALTGVGRDLWGLCDLSHLCTVATLVDACRLVCHLRRPKDFCFFSLGDRFFGGTNSRFTPRPYSDLPGDRSFKSTVAFSTVCSSVVLPHRWRQDVRNVFLIVGVVLFSSKGKERKAYSCKLSDLSLWFTPYHVEDKDLFISPLLDQVVVGHPLLIRLFSVVHSKMIQYFKQQTDYGPAISWLSGLVVSLDLQIDTSSILAHLMRSMTATYIESVFIDVENEAGYLNGKLLLVFPSLQYPRAFWTRIVVHPSLEEHVISQRLSYALTKLGNGRNIDVTDAFDPFNFYYCESIREGEWTSRRFDDNRFFRQVSGSLSAVLDHLNINLV